MIMDEVEYRTVSCSKLTATELTECRHLFNNHYGTWDPQSNKGSGNIKCPLSLYKTYQEDKDAYVALAMISDRIIGQAFYLRKKLVGERYVSWVLQLVVDKEYRRQGIAKTLLLSIWGFSNDYAWGLATSNAVTVKTLEKTTHRKVIPSEIIKGWNVVNQMRSNVPFASNHKVTVNESCSILHSDFAVDRNTIKENRQLYTDQWLLGQLELGDEWLAFTFQDQPPTFTQKDFDELFQNSRKIVIDAYSRMDLSAHGWNKGHPREAKHILSILPNGYNVQTIFDWGCGDGRHCRELAKAGKEVVGIDYSKNNIETAKRFQGKNEHYIYGDCRNVSLGHKCDLALCLYDVIGSSVNRRDNIALLCNIRRHLRTGGYLILSVMNLELTRKIATHTVENLREHMYSLHKLPSSNIMQKTGDVFNPEYFLPILSSAFSLIFKDLFAMYLNRMSRMDGHL